MSAFEIKLLFLIIMVFVVDFLLGYAVINSMDRLLELGASRKHKLLAAFLWTIIGALFIFIIEGKL